MINKRLSNKIAALEACVALLKEELEQQRELVKNLAAKATSHAPRGDESFSAPARSLSATSATTQTTIDSGHIATQEARVSMLNVTDKIFIEGDLVWHGRVWSPNEPTLEPSPEPSVEPSIEPTPNPTVEPTMAHTQWYFPVSTTDTTHYFLAQTISLPSGSFTIEAWVKPLESTKYWLSFCADANCNCLLLNMGTAPLSLGTWHHMVASTSGGTVKVFHDGVEAYTSTFCGESTGSLMFGEEQDCRGGCFEANSEGTGMYLDTVAIYSTAWASVPAGKTCVNLGDPTLTHLYMGRAGETVIRNKMNSVDTTDQAQIYGSGSATSTLGVAGGC